MATAPQSQPAANDDDLSDGMPRPGTGLLSGMQPAQISPALRADAKARWQPPHADPSIAPPSLVPLMARAMAGEACLGCPAVEAAFRWMLEEGRLIADLGDFVTGLSPTFERRTAFRCCASLSRSAPCTRRSRPSAMSGAAATRNRQAGRPRPCRAVQPGIRRLAFARSLPGRRQRDSPPPHGTGCANDFPILEDMKKQGPTDYAIFAIRLPGGVRSSVSITCDATGWLRGPADGGVPHPHSAAVADRSKRANGPISRAP
jgi:hypothetical protein